MSNNNNTSAQKAPYLEVAGPPLPAPRANTGCETGNHGSGNIPSDEECFRCWDRYDMPEHIREHSLVVAQAAEYLARRAEEAGRAVCTRSVRASALLHDIAKAYSIEHGGSHAQLGGAWTLDFTGNPQIAQGVLHHVYWPFEVDPERWFLPLAVLYADKRVRHDAVVTVTERYEDLFTRYGRNEEIRAKMHIGRAQALEVENALGRYLGVDLDENTFGGGRLVE